MLRWARRRRALLWHQSRMDAGCHYSFAAFGAWIIESGNANGGDDLAGGVPRMFAAMS